MVYVAQQMQQRGFDAAAADRRRDHQPAAHGGEDRAGVPTAGRARAGRLARGRCRVQPAEPGAAAGVRARRTATSRRGCASSTARAGIGRRCRYAQARRNRLQLDLRVRRVPAFTGARKVDVDLAELVPFIDWTFFFAAWELKGRFPAILDHPQHGAAARDLYEHAQRLLERIVGGKLLRARGVYGFWPANSDGDDIVLYAPGSRATGHGRPSSRASRCCASRKSSPTTSRIDRWPTSSRRSRAASPTTSARSP